MATDLDILVVGGGQAGLATGHFLGRGGLSFAIHDAGARVGDTWRSRYDSLVLFTSRRYSALPGLAMTGDPDGYPTKDEIAGYLDGYARHFDLPVVSSSRIVRLERVDGGFVAATSSGTRVEARSVIVAAGAFQRPFVPDFAGRIDPAVVQVTASAYRRPDPLLAGPVLVAGDGATGRQIALELARTRSVLLATGRKRNLVRQRVLGRDLFWWLDKTGLVRADKASRLGRIIRARDPYLGREPSMIGAFGRRASRSGRARSMRPGGRSASPMDRPRRSRRSSGPSATAMMRPGSPCPARWTMGGG